ncbi:hypothetical protein [Amorphus coralli]|uniref:hypothetical protein n=1 Tax=Amorphus coralli TaxID=340680 RepID=UPI00036405E8|nr:hypothetical protein [Amorphus coralli]
MKTTMLTAAVLAFGLTQGAMAAGLDGTWEPLSNTATSITGSIEVAEDSITFEDGSTLAIAADGSEKGKWGDQQAAVEGSIFRIDPPKDLTLLNGNKFCGLPGNKPTYLVLAPFDDGMSLIVYTGDAKPTPDADPCAIYNYAK